MAAKPLPGFRAAAADGRRLYAIGDIHGRYDLLLTLLAQISTDLSCDPSALASAKAEALANENGRVGLIFLGDAIDRGPDSAAVIEALIRLAARPRYETHFIKGNHEAALLDFLADPEAGRDWIAFGGASTLISYGIHPPGPADPPAAFEKARRALSANLPAAHRAFLQSMEPMIQIGDYAFVHAGIRPGIPLAAQDEDDLLWIRDGFIGHPGPHDRVIVHGHTWIDDQPRILAHRIGVDTGAYRTGVLTAAAIDDTGVRILQARAPARSTGRAHALKTPAHETIR